MLLQESAGSKYCKLERKENQIKLQVSQRNLMRELEKYELYNNHLILDFPILPFHQQIR